jgi:phosphopantetheine adenylyltransferase
MRYISVDGHSDLVKDKKTGAILNVNTNFEQLRKNKESRKTQQEEIKQLKNDMGEIKNLLEVIIKKMEI